MNTDTYPGEGLSLSQLTFALNEELRRTAHLSLYVEETFLICEERRIEYLCSFTSDAVSQLERDISTALRTVRELKNTFAPINRIPLDILSLIPTHLSQQRDRFRTSFVCRHWRKVFLQHGVLWSQLFAKKGGDYASTLLKRAKGSALDVITERGVPARTMTLFLPHTRQIRHLTFLLDHWADISTFSQVTSASLPLLRTLKIWITGPNNPDDQPNLLAAPLLPLFSGAVNLEEFVFKPKLAGLLNHFVFPNLTMFNLSAPPMDRFTAPDLFDFLKASIRLRTVELIIDGGTMPETIPREMVVVLPNAETFSLLVNDDDLQVYKLAAHISCPRAKYTSLLQDIGDIQMTSNLDMFPDSVSWKAITHQYTTTPVEEITLEMNDDRFMAIVTCSLTFKSSDATAIKLGFEVTDSLAPEEELELSHGEMNLEIFSQACRTIQGHPQLSHIRRLHIRDETQSFGFDYAIPITGVVWGLFRSLGPLDELVIHGFDLRILLPESGYSVEEFPAVKELTISEAWTLDNQRCVDAIVGLAKSQHELGKPFERVTICSWGIPVRMVVGLRFWVSVVDCTRP